MGKFGKKNSVNLDPASYNTLVIGESGIGKTTLVKNVCEKLVGENGYLHLDIGLEFGADAIEGIVTERIENWDKLEEVVDDIIDNKETDYPELRIVIWDTFDELILLAEAESIRLYNKKNPDKRADSINSAWGGFGKAQDKAIDLILTKMSDLKNAGVSSIFIGHVKRTDITDPVTNETYSKLTADTTQRYFNALKNKMHFIGLAYIDREIVKEKTGRQNIVTHKDITINKIVSEARVISFRDNTYSVDSKSRFAEIVDKIPFDPDEFIKALTDAIKAEKAKSGKSEQQIAIEQADREAESAREASEFSRKARENKVDEDRNSELLAQIKTKWGSVSTDLKTQVKEVMAKYNIDKLSDTSAPTAMFEEIVQIIG